MRAYLRTMSASLNWSVSFSRWQPRASSQWNVPLCVPILLIFLFSGMPICGEAAAAALAAQFLLCCRVGTEGEFTRTRLGYLQRWVTNGCELLKLAVMQCRGTLQKSIEELWNRFCNKYNCEGDVVVQ